MNKETIVKLIIEKLSCELKSLTSLVGKSKAHANSNEMQAEGKYDTRKVEASYLAGGQAKRLTQIACEINLLQNMNIAKKTSISITVGSCFQLNTESIYFLSPQTGAMTINFENQAITIISLKSPIGEAALDLEVNDSFEIEAPQGNREFLIKKIF